MELDPFVDDLATVPEAIRESYKPAEGGGFLLQLSGAGGFGLISLEKNQGTIRLLRGKERELTKLQSRLGERSLEDVLEAADSVDELKAQVGKGGGDVDAAVKAAIEKQTAAFQKKESEYQTKLEKRTARLRDMLVTGKATDILTSDKLGRRGIPKALMPHINQHVRVVESEDGDLTEEVINPTTGQAMYDNNGDPMTLDSLLLSMAQSDDYAFGFEGSGASGGGSSGAGKRGAGGGGGADAGRKKTISASDVGALSDKETFDALAAGEVIIVD